jgi:drug/metabolite transporter (DMT)-like permease
MAYLIVFASILAFTAYVWLIARDPTTRVASYAYVNPLIALLLGWLIAQERPTPLQYAGAALVLAGVASAIAGKRVARSEPVEEAA